MSDGFDRTRPEPLYHQVFLHLLDKINGGAFDDAPFPTEMEICAQLDVSRITVRRALQELEAGGLIVRGRGRGTRVVGRRAVTRLVASVEGLIETNRRLGQETTVRLLAFEYVVPSPEIARLMRLGEGELVQRAVRVRLLEDVPFSYAITFVPEQVGRTYDREELANEPLLHLLERSGVRVTRARQSIEARAATPSIAQALSIGTGAPLLKTVRTVFDEQDEVVEHIEVYYRSDLFSYEIGLERTTTEAAKTWVARP